MSGKEATTLQQKKIRKCLGEEGSALSPVLDPKLKRGPGARISQQRAEQPILYGRSCWVEDLLAKDLGLCIAENTQLPKAKLEKPKAIFNTLPALIVSEFVGLRI